MRFDPAAAEDRDIMRAQVVDQRNFELVGVLVRPNLVHLAIQAGPGQSDHHPFVVEWPDRRRHRLVGMAEPVQHIGEHGSVQVPGDGLEKPVASSPNHAVASHVWSLHVMPR